MGGWFWRYRRVSLGLVALTTFLAGGCSEPPPARVISAVPHEAIMTAHATLLLPPPAEPMIAELYDYFELVSQRAATGEIPPHWAAYLYTNYYRDMVRERPAGVPRRSLEDIRRRLDTDVEFYYIRKRPGAPQSPIGAWVWQVAPAPLGQ